MPRKKENRGRKKTLTARQAKKNALAANERWRSSHTKIVNIRLNIESDSDVISKLDSVPNKTDYIRSLIREDIDNERIWGKWKSEDE